MSKIDVLLVICVFVFCFYGVYLGIKTMHNIRQRSIDDFLEKRNKIREEIENGK